MKKAFLLTLAIVLMGQGCPVNQPEQAPTPPPTMAEEQKSPPREVEISAGADGSIQITPDQSENVPQENTPEPAPKTTEEAAAPAPATYVNYSSSALAAAHADNRKVVLFFHAAWCPTCKAAERDILSRLGELPVGLTVLKVDYDTETALKKKYGVNYQHTFVQVDASGNQVTKWISGSVSELKTRVQ